MNFIKRWRPKVILPIFFLLTAGLLLSTFYQPVNKAEAYDLEKDLPVVGSVTNLQNLLQQAGASANMNRFDLVFEEAMPMQEMPVQEMSKDSAQAPAAAGAADFSSTNVQVEGVDEADIIKTDGTYIY